MTYVIEDGDSKITITTNWVPRDLLHGWDLTGAERDEFDWIADSATVSWDEAEFFRYKGNVYYRESEGMPKFAPGWHARLSDSFFSGILYRYPLTEPASEGRDAQYDWERVIVATYCIS